MAISPRSVVSDGYLSTTKRLLVITVAGYLNFGSAPPVTPSGSGPVVAKQTGGRSQHYEEEQILRRRIMQEDEEVTEIIKQFLQWQ